MSFYEDERMRHHSLSENAARAGRYKEAAFHNAKVADYSLRLAETADATTAQSYLADAIARAELAEKMLEREPAHSSRLMTGAKQSSFVVSRSTEDEPAKVDADDAEWILTERPSVVLDDVIGLDDAKQSLKRNFIWPRQHSELYSKFNIKPAGGVLLFGPPGNGKTYFAKAIAGEVNATFLRVDGGRIKGRLVGDTERNVRRVFEVADKCERAVIFIDEADSVLASHGNSKANSFNQFLTEMDGVGNKNSFNRLIIAATNYPWLLGDAVLRSGRLGEHLYIGLPTAAAREQLLRNKLSKVPTEVVFSYAEIADRLEGHSAVEIASACDAACLKVVARCIETGSRTDCVTLADLEDALAEMPRSVTPETIAKLEAWGKERRAKG